MNFLFIKSLKKLVSPYWHYVAVTIILLMTIGMHKENILYGSFNFIDISFLYYFKVRFRKSFAFIYILLIMLVRESFYDLLFGVSTLIYFVMLYIEKRLNHSVLINSFKLFKLDLKLVYILLIFMHAILQYIFNIDSSVTLRILQILVSICFIEVVDMIVDIFTIKKINSLSPSSTRLSQ